MNEDLLKLFPRSKHDTDRAASLIALGYDRLLPIMPRILEWLQDINWPVARVIQPFLVDIGAPLAPYVRDVLFTDDELWKFFVLDHVVACSSELAYALREDLLRMAANPTKGEIQEGSNDLAKKILDALY
jgi:hypothetical protein